MSEDTYRGTDDLFNSLMAVVTGYPADAGRLATIELLAAICVHRGKQYGDIEKGKAVLEQSIETLRVAFSQVWDGTAYPAGAGD
ncbi:MAG: hypothetical protein ABSA62_13425 [Methyloceanibacter sp.]|jgi:hypothetical protein